MKNKFLKLLVIILVVNVFNSCTIIPYYKHVERTYYIDLNKYSNENFLFTSDGYNGKYKSCGFIEGSLYPEVKLRSRLDNDSLKNIYTDIGVWQIEKISIDKLIHNVNKKAKIMGADAVINLKITRKEHPAIYFNESNSNLKNYSDGYFISGFAIKRYE